jgi:hypothetical protein
MLGVFLQGVQIDQDVIQVTDDEFVHHITEVVVHQVLEACRCVGQAKRHYEVFEKPVTCSESCFPFFALSNPE